MRKLMFGLIGVGALLGLAGGPVPAIAQRSGSLTLQEDYEATRGRIAEAEELLRQVEAGGPGLLFSDGNILRVVPREQLVNWATRELYAQGLGSRSAGDELVFRRVRQIAAQSAGFVSALRLALRDDIARRDRMEREFARLRGNATAAANCGFPRSWQVRMADGSVEVAVDAAGNASGPGIQRGRATLAGNQLTLQWFAQAANGELAGRYVVSLDGACNGAGELIMDILPPGATSRGGPVTFTSRGAGPA